MTKPTRRRFSPEYKEQLVARLSGPGARHSSVAAELGVTPTQLKTWRLELEAVGSAAARAAQKAEAAELAQLRRDNKRQTEEVEVLRRGSAFFAQWAAKRCRRSTLSTPPMLQSTPSGSCAGSWGLLIAGSTPGGVRPQRELSVLPGVAGSGPRSGRSSSRARGATAHLGSMPG